MEHEQPSTQPSEVVYERAVGDRQTQALSLLLTGQRLAGGGAVDQFRAFASEHDFSLDHIWVAIEQQKPVASVMVVPSAGRTGMIFLSPIARAHRVAMHGGLARAACENQVSEGAQLIQALLEMAQKHEAQALRAAGFTDLATLLYMQKRTSEALRPLLLESAFDVHHWRDEQHDAFAAAISASYEQTQDCPGLLGLRDLNDIVAGHRATGEFDPDLWYVVTSEDEPVGVMLLNKVPQQQALELVYLGLAPKWRGRGLARRLLEHGLGHVSRCGYSKMLLAVDDTNEPALQLYRSLGFVESGRKVALIFSAKKR